MNKLPRVDVLIPHYENADGLALSLRSVAFQDECDFRVVVADDGSSPKTLGEVERVCAESGLLVDIIRHRSNFGRPRMRNVLLDAMESDYAAWLDAGDEWYPAKTRTQLKCLLGAEPLDAERKAWVTCNYDLKWQGKPAVRCTQEVAGDQTRNLLAGRNLRAYLWTVLARSIDFRDTGYFDEALPRLQDIDFFLRFTSVGGTLIEPDTQETLCVYNRSNWVQGAGTVYRSAMHLMQKHAQLYDGYGPRFRGSCRFEYELIAGRLAVLRQRYDLAIWHYSRALIGRPATFVLRLIERIRRQTGTEKNV